MRVLVAPDSFKGTLNAVSAAEVISAGLRQVLPEVELDLCPMADGGQGLVAAFSSARNAEIKASVACDPLGREIDATWSLHRPSKTAVLEIAAASGFERLAPSDRDPLTTTTFGTGQIINTAIHEGARTIIVGLGDSATIDGGLGLCQALGVRLEGISGYATGGKLQQIRSVVLSDLHPEIPDIDLIVACDVENPLCGPNGAVQVFGAQKGATAESTPILASGLEHLAHLINLEASKLPGSGAAGGAAFGMRELLGARLVRGIELVMNFVDFDVRAKKADLIITGEGRLDSQSLQGKTCIGLSRRARDLHVPVIALAGSITGNTAGFAHEGISACYSLTDIAPDMRCAMDDAAAYLEEAARYAFTRFLYARDHKNG